MTTASRPKLIVDGKLDHAAITAELRRCLDTLLQKSRFQLSYEIRTIGPAASTELENPEIVVEFKGRDQDLLLEQQCGIAAGARTHRLALALARSSILWARPIRRRRLSRHSHRRIETFRACGRRARARNARAISLQCHVLARTAHPASGFERGSRSAQRERRHRRRTASCSVSRELKTTATL